MVRDTRFEDLLGEAERPRLFDLKRDPLELQGRFDAADPEALAAAAELFKALREHSYRLPIRESQVVRGKRDLRAEGLFRSLGYGGGVGADGGGGEDD